MDSKNAELQMLNFNYTNTPTKYIGIENNKETLSEKEKKLLELNLLFLLQKNRTLAKYQTKSPSSKEEHTFITTQLSLIPNKMN